MTTARRAAPHQTPPVIFRQVSFSLRAFNLLKAWQRHLERSEGRALTNSEMLDRLILTNPLP
jgi:hypothetical protein